MPCHGSQGHAPCKGKGSGKKLVVDAYGLCVPIGAGAWSPCAGKDFSKADRAGGLHARRLAKATLQLGMASEAWVVLGWSLGDREGRVLRVETAGRPALDAGRLGRAFDLSLLRGGIVHATFGLSRIGRWGRFAGPKIPRDEIAGL
ncbi:MAG: hypothetical protein Fur0037_14940 [Planctomycetota bacterium]